MALFLVSLRLFAEEKSVFFITLLCPFSVLFKNIIFMEAGHRSSMESRALHPKTGSLATEKYQCLRKAGCLLYRDGVMSLSPQIKMSFTLTTKICRKMLAIQVWNIKFKLQTNPTELCGKFAVDFDSGPGSDLILNDLGQS